MPKTKKLYKIFMIKTFVNANEVLKRALSLLSLSQSGLSLLIGKDQATIYRYVHGDIAIPDSVFSYVMGLLQRNEIDPLMSLGIAEEESFIFIPHPRLLMARLTSIETKGALLILDRDSI